MNAQGFVLAAVFLALGGWFFVHNHSQLNSAARARHIVFIGLV